MSNDYLMSNDYMTGGVYRAFIIKKDEARVYIPGLLNKNILDSNNDISNADFEKIKKALPKPLYNSKEIENLLDDKPTPCFVSFENGNMKRPIVLGYFGNGVKSVPGSSSNDSGYSNSQGGTYNGTGTTGSDNGDYVFNKLIEAGASIAGACGVLGNLYAESTTFDPKEQYMGHVGIAQWDVSRFTTLKLYCGSQSLDPYSIEGQTAFLIDELKNDSDWKQRSKKRTNLEGWNNISKNEETELYALKVQEVVRLDFEKCGDQGKSVREDATKRFFKSFSKNGKIVNGKYESSVNNCNEIQKKIVEYAKTFKGGQFGNGSNSSKSGFCEAWVEDVIYNVTGYEKLYDSAKLAGIECGVSSDLSNIPIGACVWAIYNPNGHAAIYLGNGMIANNRNDNPPSIDTLEYYKNWASDKPGFQKMVWGWLGKNDLSKK